VGFGPAADIRVRAGWFGRILRVVVVYADDLERGRESYARRAWSDAYDSFSRADQAASLGAEELELLARSAYMRGLDDEYLSGFERAHAAHLL
jgi:predicted TPR repeat methyltransferase